MRTIAESQSRIGIISGALNKRSDEWPASAMQVLYLVLVQLLDTRGNQLEPPPPEAFEQGWLQLLTSFF